MRMTTSACSSLHAVCPRSRRPDTTRALLTREWTPLEPGVVDHKLYVRGVGLVDERTIRGGNERNTLVRWTR